MNIFNDLFGSLIRALYDLTRSYGLAIILFTVITRVIFVYFNGKAKRSTLKMQRLAPKQKEIEAKYKNDRVKAQQAIQQLQQQEGINPMSGCLWSLIPLPIMMILYSILRAPLSYIIKIGDNNTIKQLGVTIKEFAANLKLNGAPLTEKAIEALTPAKDAVPDQINLINILSQNGTELASKIDPDVSTILYEGTTKLQFNHTFLGIDLLASPNSNTFSLLLLVPIIAAALTYLSAYLSQKWSGVQQQKNMNFMFLLFPVMTFIFAYTMPTGIGLYWIAGSLYTIVQDYFMTKHYVKVLDVEDAKKAELEARRKAAEAAMKEELRQQRAADIASGKRKKPTSYKLKNKPQSKPPKAAEKKSEPPKADD